MTRILLASLHLLAFGIGLGAVWTRGHVLRAPGPAARLPIAFRADSLWALAAFLWVSTGLWRWLGGVEKTASYYPGNHIFLAKMGLFVLILILEVRAIVTIGRWRRQVARGMVPDLSAAPTLGLISYAQAIILLCMVIAATAMARGYGVSGG
jgi:putative membrane protein